MDLAGELAAVALAGRLAALGLAGEHQYSQGGCQSCWAPALLGPGAIPGQSVMRLFPQRWPLLLTVAWLQALVLAEWA